jgi:DNA-nicking Smr family endonuclease
MAGKRAQPKPGASSRRHSAPRKNTGGADDDAALWGQIAGTVKPLKRRRAAPAPEKPGGNVKPAAEAPVETPARSAKPRPPAPTHVPPAPLAPGAASGIDKRTAQRLRRGQIRIEGRIDLHGMTQVEAYRNLSDFLKSSATAGRRCVLVITGKGMREGAGSGILRSEFPRWLNEAALRPLILGFAVAQPKDGGGGAFYVYLRRHRTS